jgi:hypothetical protein
MGLVVLFLRTGWVSMFQDSVVNLVYFHFMSLFVYGSMCCAFGT